MGTPFTLHASKHQTAGLWSWEDFSTPEFYSLCVCTHKISVLGHPTETRHYSFRAVKHGKDPTPYLLSLRFKCVLRRAASSEFSEEFHAILKFFPYTFKTLKNVLEESWNKIIPFKSHLFLYLFLLHFDKLPENVTFLMNSKELSQITSPGDQNKMRNTIILI